MADPSDFDLDVKMRHLRIGAEPIGAKVLPAVPGIYGIVVEPNAILTGLDLGEDRFLYVGISSSLERRTLENHFCSGSTGFSTLRRSLGALLKDELSLVAFPRTKGPSPSNTQNYRFDDGGEGRLTAWMLKNLRLAFVPLGNPESMEREIINRLTPALNLTGWDNPNRRLLKKLRAACVAEAKLSRPE